MKQPCALVLDCFKAHCTKTVRRFAKEQYIELIFVPANGTSDFQSLDRRAFGILKSKLRSLAGSRIFSGKQRFEMITRDLVNAWSEISKENLISAWNLPNLENLVHGHELVPSTSSNCIRNKYRSEPVICRSVQPVLLPLFIRS